MSSNKERDESLVYQFNEGRLSADRKWVCVKPCKALKYARGDYEAKKIV